MQLCFLHLQANSWFLLLLTGWLFFSSSRMKSPALFQLQPKSKVTGFASFSQLLLGNANADADSSTGFLCRKYHIRTGSIPNAAREKRAHSSFKKKPNRSFRAIKHNINTKSIGKMDFPHLFPTGMRVGFVPVLCPAYLLLATGCLRLLSSSGLHCSRTPQASPASPLSSWTTTNGFGKL